MKKLIFLLVLTFPLLLQAQIGAWQIKGKTKLNTNVPAGQVPMADGVGKVDWGKIDTTKVEGLQQFVEGHSVTSVTGTEPAFNTWDKNAADDFDGDYNSLINKPTIPADDQTASEVSISDAGALITAINVEGALQENRTAINLNTAKTSFPGFTSLLADYSFTDNSANWNTAYGWGNHTGLYEPLFSKNTAFNKNFGTITGTVAQGDDSRINNGQTAFGWGNHASGGYQAVLVSGTNIKTVNGSSLLGSGNLSISGSGAADSVFVTMQADTAKVGTNIEMFEGKINNDLQFAYNGSTMFKIASNYLTNQSYLNSSLVMNAGNDVQLEFTGGSGIKIKRDASGNLILDDQFNTPKTLTELAASSGSSDSTFVSAQINDTLFIGSNGKIYEDGAGDLSLNSGGQKHISLNSTGTILHRTLLGSAIKSNYIGINNSWDYIIQKHASTNDIEFLSPVVGSKTFAELARKYNPTQTLAYSTDPVFDVSVSNNQKTTLTGDIDTLYVTNLGDGQAFQYEITGSYGIEDIFMSGMNVVYQPGVKPTSGNIDATNGTIIAGVRFGSNLHIYFKHLEPKEVFCYTVACSDETTDLTTGTAKRTFVFPFAATVTDVVASVNTAPVGSTLNIDLNEAGISVFSTVLSIDASEKISTTAATPAVISDTQIAQYAEMTVDVDQIGSTTAGAGLKLLIYYTKN